METPCWRAGFELELILGDLGEPRFADHMDVMGPMDKATPAFCEEVARRLSAATGVRWSAPRKPVRQPGYYVLAEYDLDPLDWPRDRCAGVELLTPPLEIEEADSLRFAIASAVHEIDGFFNSDVNEITAQCAWHINIDAGALRLDPSDFILCVDELALLSENGRLFTPYTGLQRHAAGVPILRMLAQPGGRELLASVGLDNLLSHWAGRSKRYATNFAKLERGYVELRHFASTSFFDDIPLSEHLSTIPAAFGLWFSQSQPLREAYAAKLCILQDWLLQYADRISWTVSPGLIAAGGTLGFGSENLGYVHFDGSTDLSIYGAKNGDGAASIRGLELRDVREGLALLALDLAELASLGDRRVTGSAAFNDAVAELGSALAADPRLSSECLSRLVLEAASERERTRAGYASETLA